MGVKTPTSIFIYYYAPIYWKMYYDFLILKIGPHGLKMKIELCNFSVKWGRVLGHSKIDKKKPLLRGAWFQGNWLANIKASKPKKSKVMLKAPLGLHCAPCERMKHRLGLGRHSLLLRCSWSRESLGHEFDKP